jgi:hypothetical protein
MPGLWQNENPAVITLASTGVITTVTGTTAETALYTVAIPNGIMGPNSAMRIEPAWSYTNSSNSKSLRLRIGATMAGPIVYDRTRNTSSLESPLIVLINRGVQNVQVNVYAPTGSYGNNAPNFVGTNAFDFAAAGLNFYVTGQLTNTGESISLEALMVSVLNPYR